MKRAQTQRQNSAGADPTFESLFDGTPETFRRWRQAGPSIVTLTGDRMVTSAAGDFGLLFYTHATFGDFILQLEFSLADPQVDNSGVFVRFRDPRLAPSKEITAKDNFLDIAHNRAWIAAYSGFEIQIDERARGSEKYGETDGLDKHRTGAIYGIPTGQSGEPRMQQYTRPEKLKANQWNLYEIEVVKQTYVAHLNGKMTTKFINSTEWDRGLHPETEPTSGYIGVQSYRDSHVAFRNIRVKQL